MAAVQTRALTSHLRARDTGKVSKVGEMRKHLLLCYNYFHTTTPAISSIFNIYYFVTRERTCGDVYDSDLSLYGGEKPCFNTTIQ